MRKHGLELKGPDVQFETRKAALQQRLWLYLARKQMYALGFAWSKPTIRGLVE